MSRVTYDPDWPHEIPDTLLEYTADELESLPTLSTGQADDLKVEEEIDGIQYRVWLSRCKPSDGEPHLNKITVEGLGRRDRRWTSIAHYKG